MRGLRCFGVIALLAATAWAQGELRGITVTGSGTVYGEPDMAVFEVGVNVLNEDLSLATAEADAAMRRMTEALVAAGVAERDIRTVTFNIWREEPWGQERPKPAFRVMNTVRVTVREVARAGELLSLSLASGANTVNSIQYTLADPTGLMRQARELAMADALAKAEQLAALAGVALGEVTMISETPVGMTLFTERAVMMGAGGPDGVPLAAGELAVTVSLVVNFAIR
ncbi:MAG: SIMPL domain-containing protein [Truepera sp.]|nr:SIMPL domain-containing protein [Truepera sp.]